MQVQFTTQNLSKTPQFSGWYRTVNLSSPEKGMGKVNRNNTEWFRLGGIPDIVDTLVQNFGAEEHVNTYIYGCSNGCDSVSMYIYMASKYGMDVLSKFIPFKCVDIDKIAIAKAINGEMPATYAEFKNILKYTNGKIKDFFQDMDSILNSKDLRKVFDKTQKFEDGSIEEGIYLKLKPEHAQNFEYSVGNLFTDYQNIEPEKSIVGTRNFLPYLGCINTSELFTLLGKHLKKGCALFPGEYDFGFYDSFLHQILRENEFSKAKGKSPYVFIKN